MDITTQYSIDDAIWYMSSNKPFVSDVKEIKVDVTKVDYQIRTVVFYKTTNGMWLMII